MASIIKASINLNNIDKSKIIEGKKGKYLPITITINDEPDQFGNQGPIVIAQSKEEREAKVAKTYLGNVQVVWTNGTNVPAAPRDGQPAQAQPLPHTHPQQHSRPPPPHVPDVFVATTFPPFTPTFTWHPVPQKRQGALFQLISPAGSSPEAAPAR